MVVCCCQMLSDTTRRGTLSKNRKYCLSLAKIKAKGQPRGLGRFSDSPEACVEASDERPKLFAPSRPSRRGPAPQCRDTNSLIRPRLGSATTSSPPSQPTPLTKRHVQSIRPTTPATSAARWHSTGRMTDGTGNRAQQGLPTTVLITVPPADTRTALCYLTPAPRTKWRGGSSPGPSSLGQHESPTVRPPPRPRPPGRASDVLFLLRLNRPSGEPSHPFQCTWSHLLCQP